MSTDVTSHTPNGAIYADCPSGHPIEADTVACTRCDRNRVARCKPGYLDRLHELATTDVTAEHIHTATIDAIVDTAARITVDLPASTGLHRVALISEGVQLLRIVADHAHYPADRFDGPRWLEHTLRTAAATAGLPTADIPLLVPVA